ncbi:unnamed protein product [Musa acuminata subsp. malaccensis]|uniref:(wild Malaysian banana) hypothetical protein n=1 Tax=Musa acuminata subsp. malaccensis TaxID=214687 RepID=A0A804IUT3_MUSAM|nr:unnamed protein product [Musa acuminata subsp. malaccensis]
MCHLMLLQKQTGSISLMLPRVPVRISYITSYDNCVCMTTVDDFNWNSAEENSK